MPPFVLDVNLRVKSILGLEKVKQQLANIQIGGAGQAQKLSTGLGKVGVNAASAAIHIAKAGRVTVQLGKSAKRTGNQMDKAAKGVQNFGDQIWLAGKRYAAFLSATVGAFKAFQAISVGTKSVIEFDQAMVSLSQIIDIPVNQLGRLSQQFLDLSVTTGTSAAEIANAAKLLAQAGFRGTELTEAVESLSKVPLTPIFENMEQAVDGAIAAMRQFSNEGLTVEQVFDKMISVSNKYAASFPDIIEGLKRGGSAFQAIGGTLDEFIAAFTTIRSVTRESASSVGTSLKTISSRLADPKILKFLETKDIRLIEKGQFVGPLEALKRIGDGFERVKSTQEKVNIAVKLGGRRQISRFLALAQNIEKVNEVLGISKDSFGDFNKVAQQGLQAVSKQIDILVAKSKKLAIDLGEDLFIPFIQGLANATDGAISLLDALRPIIPTIAKIGALAVGVAAFRGVGGIVGQQLGKFAGPAAFAAAGGGLKGARAGILASPFAQAGLLIAAGELAASFAKTTDDVDTFASTLIRSTALVSAGIALFRQQTIAQFAAGGGLFPTLGKMGKLGAIGGTLATIGAIALPLAVLEGKRSAKELSDKIVASAIESVAAIKIDPTDPISVRQGINDLYRNIGQGVRELIKEADVRDDPTISKIFRGIGRTVSNVIEGDYETLIRRGGLTKRDIGDFVQNVLSKNTGIINNLIDSVANSIVAEGGLGGRPSIEQKKLIETIFMGGGLDAREANEFANAIIEASGGIDAWNDHIRKAVNLLQQEANRRSQLIEVMRPFISPRLGGQLLQFSKAVDETTRAITVSAKLFESQIAEIGGGIVAPAFAFDFDPRQIEKFVSAGGLRDLFAFTPDIPKFISSISEMEDLLDQFIINISNLPTDANLPTEIDKFFDFQRNVPPIIREHFSDFFQTIATDIQSAAEGKLITAEEIKGRFEKEFADIGIGATNAAIDTISKFLNGTFTQIQDELNRLATVRKFELAVPVRPETQAAFLAEQLRRVNITAPYTPGPTRTLRGTFEELELRRMEQATAGIVRARQGFLPTPSIGFFQGRGQRLADIAGDERVRQQVRDSFARLTVELSSVRKELAAMKPGAKGFMFATERAKELGRQIIELQTAMTGLDQATQQALTYEMQTLKLRQEFELRQKRAELETLPQGISPIKAQRAIFDLQQKHLQEQAALQEKFDVIIEKDHALRVNLAKEVSNINRAQSQSFDTSINIFADATRAQVTATELMQKYIQDFGQAVIDFKNLGNIDRPTDDSNVARITPAQIRSGGVNVQQALDELNRLLNRGNANETDMINLLNAIYDRQEQVQTIKSESSVEQKEQERDFNIGDNMDKLTISLDNLRTTLNEPNELRLVTDQRIDLDLSTLPMDISDEIRPILEEAVTLAAKTVTRKALESLAAKSESELAIAATNAAQELV